MDPKVGGGAFGMPCRDFIYSVLLCNVVYRKTQVLLYVWSD